MYGLVAKGRGVGVRQEVRRFKWRKPLEENQAIVSISSHSPRAASISAGRSLGHFEANHSPNPQLHPLHLSLGWVGVRDVAHDN
ncbi:unnamed protein product [Gadus morhua 'NCC']